MTPPNAMTIAGSDCSAGAGMQADLKTFSSLGVHGLTAVSCVVSETPLTLNDIHPVPPEILKDQVQLLLNSYPVNAIKTGMLFSAAHIRAVCDLLETVEIPIVVDPVMVASTGDSLLAQGATEAMVERLLPLSSVITPNLPEAEALLDRKIIDAKQHEEAALELAERFDTACYLKGGHRIDAGIHRDFFVCEEGNFPFSAPHLEIEHSHGTGCTFAAALTAGIAEGLFLKEAAEQAHRFTHQALAQSISWVGPGSNQKIHHLDQVQR